jgi:hypothetical protein
LQHLGAGGKQVRGALPERGGNVGAEAGKRRRDLGNLGPDAVLERDQGGIKPAKPIDAVFGPSLEGIPIGVERITQGGEADDDGRGPSSEQNEGADQQLHRRRGCRKACHKTAKRKAERRKHGKTRADIGQPFQGLGAGFGQAFQRVRELIDEPDQARKHHFAEGYRQAFERRGQFIDRADNALDGDLVSFRGEPFGVLHDIGLDLVEVGRKHRLHAGEMAPLEDLRNIPHGGFAVRHFLFQVGEKPQQVDFCAGRDNAVLHIFRDDACVHCRAGRLHVLLQHGLNLGGELEWGVLQRRVVDQGVDLRLERCCIDAAGQKPGDDPVGCDLLLALDIVVQIETDPVQGGQPTLRHSDHAHDRGAQRNARFRADDLVLSEGHGDGRDVIDGASGRPRRAGHIFEHFAHVAQRSRGLHCSV